MYGRPHDPKHTQKSRGGQKISNKGGEHSYGHRTFDIQTLIEKLIVKKRPRLRQGDIWIGKNTEIPQINETKINTHPTKPLPESQLRHSNSKLPQCKQKWKKLVFSRSLLLIWLWFVA